MSMLAETPSTLILPEKPRTAKATASRFMADPSLVAVRRITIGLVVVGSGLQGYANSTFAGLPVGLLFLLFGYLAVSLAFPGRRPEMRVFMLTYGVGVLSGGLAQWYSLYFFQSPQSFSDAIYFLGAVSPKPPFRQLGEIPGDNLIAIATWQQLYAVTWWLGLKFGPYVAIMFNALIMSFAGSLTVATARALFGDDSWRLRRVGTLFAFCGLFVLFESIMLRDSFVVFVNALWLWGIVRWLTRPSARTSVVAAVLTGLAVYAMLFLRGEVIILFGVYTFLAIVCWALSGKLNSTRLVLVIFFICALPIGGSYIRDYLLEFRDAQASGQEHYALLSATESKQNSLAMQMVVNQPLPVQIVAAMGTLLVNPIPLWANFKSGAQEYHLALGYHGIYQVLVLPLGFAGIFGIVRLFRKEGRKALPLMFLSVYLLVSLAAVAASSQTERHLGQFMAALLILAVVPDTQNKGERKTVRRIATLWFAAVILVHVAWAAVH